MPYDVVAANSRATQVGTQLGQAMFNNSLRMQQLQSEQALQRLQQQQAAETLSWTMRQHSMAIDQEAQNAKRTAAFMAMIAPTINMPAPQAEGGAPISGGTEQVPYPNTEGMSPMIGEGGEDASHMIGPDGLRMGTGAAISNGFYNVDRPSTPGMSPMIGGGTMAVPNPLHTPDYGEAYIKAFLPGSNDPAKVIATAGALMYHQSQMTKNLAAANASPKPLSTVGKMQSDRAAAVQRGDTVAVKEIDDAIARQAGPGAFDPTAKDVTLTTGDVVHGIQTSKNAWQPFGTGELKTIERDGRQFYIDLKGAPHPLPQDQQKRITMMALHNMVKDNLDLAVQNPDAPKGMLMPDPAKESLLIQRQATTPALKTKLETQLAQSERTISSLDDLEKTLRPEDVGVKGVVGSELGDIWLPQLGFDSADIKRMDNRTRLKSLAEGMLREVSDDTRFSNADREDIKGIVPRAGMRESYPDSIQTIRTLRSIFAKRAIINSKSLGRPTPLWAIAGMNADRLVDTAQAGLIDRAGMLDAVRMHKLDPQVATKIWYELHPEEAPQATQPTP